MERQERIAHLVHAARTREPRTRDAFLSEACGGDAALRSEVERLLAAGDASGARSGGPDLHSLESLPTATVPVSVAQADRVAHYRIMGRIGAGGMGEVYRARDERLDREVAIKMLPSGTFTDPTARARLVREARAAAALNHPHICTVYDVGEADGQTYITMELLEGRTLAATLAASTLDADEVVNYGRQLASALSHAHARGIVHRDLKSANVIVTPERRLKVLDFGLARRLTSEDMASALTRLDASLTQPGVAVGTLAYMSPEQLRGEAARTASDVWALGIVLYEMAAGMRPFGGGTAFALSAEILNNTDPPSLPGHAPSALAAVIAKCLEKDAARRYQDGSAVLADLEAIRLDTDRSRRAPGPASATRSIVPSLLGRVSRRRAVGVGATAGLAVLVGSVTWRLLPGPTVQSLAVLPFDNVSNDEDIDYLCDGIARAVISHLSGHGALRVSPLRAVLNLKGRAIDPRTAGRDLGVDAVVTGTLQARTGRLQVTTELIDVERGASLWRQTYDRDESELIAMQLEMARAIADDGLRLVLDSHERRRLVAVPTTDGEAYDLYLQAAYISGRGTEEDHLYARELLRRATARDHDFALAYMALGASHAVTVHDGYERPTDGWPSANRYVRQAAELDPETAAPLVTLMAHAQAFWFDWDWAGAERHRRRFVQSLTPYSAWGADALRAFAIERWALGRLDEATELARRAREIDPLTADLRMMEADYLVHAGEFDTAIALYQRSIRMDPVNANPYFGLAEALFRQGRFEEAIDARRQAHAVAGDDALADVLATARGEGGYRSIERAWVELQLAAYRERALTDYVSPLDLARAFAQLGNRDEAFRHLDLAFNDRSPGLVYLKVDRAWDAVRDDPRFLAAVQRVGLP